MRCGYLLVSLVGMMVASAVLSAQPADGAAAAGDPAAAPAPPPGGYPPPPPGYYEAPPPPNATAKKLDLHRRTGARNSVFAQLRPNIGDFAGRVGFSYIGLSARSNDGSSDAHASLITVPLTVTYLGLGSQKNMFEIGGGVTVVHVSAGANSFAVSDSKSEESNTLLLGNLVFGYRLQPPEGGFLLRTGLSPIFGGGAFIPLPYLALVARSEPTRVRTGRAVTRSRGELRGWIAGAPSSWLSSANHWSVSSRRAISFTSSPSTRAGTPSARKK